MAKMMDVSRGLSGRTALDRLLGVFKLGWSRVSPRRRAPRLRMEEWPDYLLKDVGLGRAANNRTDPRAMPLNWTPR